MQPVPRQPVPRQPVSRLSISWLLGWHYSALWKLPLRWLRKGGRIWRARRMRLDLAELSDSALKDIGLTRGDLRAIRPYSTDSELAATLDRHRAVRSLDTLHPH